jgi:hypothetical protein
VLDNQRIYALSCGVEGRRQTGGTAAYNHQVIEGPLCFRADAQLGGELGIRGFDQYRAIHEDDGRDYLLAIVDLLDVPSSLFVWSMSTQLYATLCSPRNCLDCLQSGHQGAPYTVISAAAIRHLRHLG